MILNPLGKQWEIIESSKAIVFFSNWGKYDIIFGFNLSSYLVFNSSKLHSYIWSSKKISGDIPIIRK